MGFPICLSCCNDMFPEDQQDFEAHLDVCCTVQLFNNWSGVLLRCTCLIRHYGRAPLISSAGIAVAWVTHRPISFQRLRASNGHNYFWLGRLATVNLLRRDLQNATACSWNRYSNCSVFKCFWPHFDPILVWWLLVRHFFWQSSCRRSVVRTGISLLVP